MAPTTALSGRAVANSTAVDQPASVSADGSAQDHVTVVERRLALLAAVEEVAGVDKKSLLEWVANGLLPPPLSARGRGIVSKWPIITLELAKFVREYREKGFAMREIRPLLVRAFGPRILKVVQEPRPLRGKGKVAADAAEAAAKKKVTPVKKAVAKKAASRAS